MRTCLAIIMCGLIGILSPNQAVGADKEPSMQQMIAALDKKQSGACEHYCTPEKCQTYGVLKHLCVKNCNGCSAQPTAGSPSASLLQRKSTITQSAGGKQGEGKEDKTAIQKLLEVKAEKDKPQVCSEVCTRGRCGDSKELTTTCQQVCGAKYARDCHVKAMSEDIERKIRIKRNQDAAKDILKPPSGISLESICAKKCARSLNVRLKKVINPCKDDPAFGQFCILHCPRKTVINCSHQMEEEDIKATKIHEADPVLGVSKTYRNKAMAIEKEKTAVTDLNQATPALIKACNSCTGDACKADSHFQKFCTDNCPLYTAVKCGLTQDMLGDEVPSQTKLLEYYEKVGNARKTASIKPPAKEGSYPELAEALHNICTVHGCDNSASRKNLCTQTFDRMNPKEQGGLFFYRGLKLIRQRVPLQTVCQHH